jgi:hypothetical protein
MLFAALFMMVTSPVSDAAAEDVAVEEAATTLPVVGQAAPDFIGIDSKGVTHTLAQHRGHTVVLEWTNNQCPFVRKHYDTGSMQETQKEATKDGVVWLTVNSAAQGKQGFVTADQANEIIKKENAHQTAYLLDPAGTIGHEYGASTTPHMFVINPEGVLVYAGGIDDQPSVSHSTIKTATNYVKAALADLKAGHAVKVSSSKPYGCAVKY